MTVGEETWRLTRREFGYESLGDVTVAGRAQAVAIFEVIAGGAAEVETAAPFVGRAPEMASPRRATNFDLEDRAEASALLHLWAAEPGESP